MRMRTDAAYASMGFLRIPSMKPVKMDICILMRMNEKKIKWPTVHKKRRDCPCVFNNGTVYIYISRIWF